MAYKNLAQGLDTLCIAFDGDRLIAEGKAGEVALRVKDLLATQPGAQILIFDDDSSRPIEIDFAGTDDDLHQWIESWKPKEATSATGPGRPKLGVVAREVTLLPRHWEWLGEQPGGASVALRKLVDEARKANAGKDAYRQAQESAYRFAVTMAGDRAGFEEASRALFANDVARFEAMTEDWPIDVRDHARALAIRAFAIHWDATP